MATASAEPTTVTTENTTPEAPATESNLGSWILLIVAGIIEVGYAVSVGGSQGFTHAGWSISALVFFLFTLFFLSLALRRIDVGIGYAVWVGIGAVGAVVASAFFFDEPVTLTRVFWLSIIIAGVVWLKLADRPAPSGAARPTTVSNRSVRQLRVVVEAEDYEQALAFYRDALGLPEVAAVAEGEGEKVAILDVGRATLELTNPAHRRAIDAAEAGGDLSRRIRLAFEVDDAAGVTTELAAAGAKVTSEPVLTPWRSLNSRLEAPADLQITLFQEDAEQAHPLHGSS
ncbi:SMR family transporter [Nesterenkonia rhizosphaerae]|uniref:VOC domain-containing protein n=1 Tax=Nesterenkonia rhizosphaerae TaxID=1348272 RepID=A0ABP9G3R0_9MICC